MKGNGYISDFDATAKQGNTVNPGGPIDFSIAHKIEGNTGSTCDVYVAQYHHTKVLVKKLKPHLKDKVLYRSALEKEFTLGFRLKHNGLPTYREFHENYIIMEFVEGDTLLSLLQREDSWLSREGNIRKLLIQLLDVIAYLHSNGISHCDIKPDNIMITKNHHNLVLIDLDKTYTSFTPNSAGSTSKFDVEESQTGHPDMDFHGVGKLVDRVIRTIPGLPVKKFRQFEKLCMGTDVDSEILIEWLENSIPHNGKNSYRKKGRNGVLIGLGAMIACLIMLAVVGLVLDSRDREDKINEESIITPIPQAELQRPISEETEVSSSQQKRIITKNDNVDIRISEKTSYKKEIESQMISRVVPLVSALQEGKIVLENPNSTDTELREVIFKLANTQSEITTTAYADFEKQYPSVEPMEIQMAVINTKSFKETTKEASELIQKITDEIVARNPKSYSN